LIESRGDFTQQLDKLLSELRWHQNFSKN
jgi:hypothetical protein